MNHFQEPSSPANLADVNRRKWFIAARHDKERKAQIEEQSDDALLDIAVAVIVATEIETQAFQTKLDTYDEATVIALMGNQELLDAVNDRIVDMLSRAHELDDGRRVFKTQDGKHVFNAYGEQVDEAIIHPDEINDNLPKWEEYQPLLLEQKHLMQERDDLLEYQEKLDHARERSNSDGFTKNELDELDAELEADMPIEVSRQLPDYDPANEEILKTDFTASATPPALSATDMAIDPSMVPNL